MVSEWKRLKETREERVGLMTETLLCLQLNTETDAFFWEITFTANSGVVRRFLPSSSLLHSSHSSITLFLLVFRLFL